MEISKKILTIAILGLFLTACSPKEDSAATDQAAPAADAAQTTEQAPATTEQTTTEQAPATAEATEQTTTTN